jgi:RNase adaptor protein for sRNA GlmZ degradation
VNFRQIVFDDIRIVDNPFYNKNVKEMMQGEE